MTTVGYGDIYPVTAGGRIFTIIACICGSFMLSLIMAKLTELIALDSDQSAAYEEIMNEKKIENTKQVKLGLLHVFYKYCAAKILLKKGRGTPQNALIKRIMIYKYVAKIQYQNELIKHLDPQLGDAIGKLTSATSGFIKTSAKKLKVFQLSGVIEGQDNSILDLICDIRKRQVGVDQKALEMYDITLKLNSFLCMTNRMGKNQPLKKIDKLKMFFSSDGQKNKHVRSVLYLQEFMHSRDPLIKFFADVEQQKKKFAIIVTNKKKREEERKKREQLKKEKLDMIKKKK